MNTTPEHASTEKTRKPNRRGVAARQQLMATAVRLLGEGRPDAVSINLVAKEAGLSWGSVQNLYGDSDGFWSTVVENIIERGSELWAEPVSDDVAGRLAEVAALYSGVLASPYGIAVQTLRTGLPRPRSVLAETLPKTAAALTRVEEMWEEAFLAFFEGLDTTYDHERVLDAAAVMSSTLRGLRADQVFGTAVDVERAQRSLVAMLTAYLEG